MKWTITELIYATFASVFTSGTCYELGVPMIGTAMAVIAIIAMCIAFLKYLNGDHLS